MERLPSKRQLDAYIRQGVLDALADGETNSGLGRRLGVTPVYILHIRDGARGVGEKLINGFCAEFHNGDMEELNAAVFAYAQGKNLSRHLLQRPPPAPDPPRETFKRLKELPGWKEAVKVARKRYAYLPEYAYERVGEHPIAFEPVITPEWVHQTVTWWFGGVTAPERERVEREHAKRQRAKRRARAAAAEVAKDAPPPSESTKVRPLRARAKDAASSDDER